MKIDIVPYCGLGNRLNTIASAIALRQRTQNELTIYWEKAWDCSAWFDELFMPIDGLEVKRLEHFYMKSPGKRELWLPRLMRRFVYDATYKAKKIVNTDMLVAEQTSASHIFIEGNRPFCQYVETSMLSRFFRPIAEIQRRIDDFTSQFTSFTVGVHVRRTDHKDVIASNPLDSYVSLMRSQEEEHPGCLFYLASDDKDVKAYMSNLFPNRIITNDHLCLERDSVRGIQDAVLELYCLGKTNLIIGSKGSTYSELAAKLFDTPVIFP